MLPIVQARTFKSQFAFAGPPHVLDLPAPGIGKHQGPQIICGGDRFSGEQIPGWQVMVASANHEPEMLRNQSRIRMVDGQSEHLQLDGALMDGIPSWRVLPTA
jgi:hypothetical protein